MVKPALGFLVLLLSLPASARAQEIVALQTRPGVTQTYFLTRAPDNLRAVAVLFPGSGGYIRIRTENGQIKFDAQNFLVRSRVEFVNRGVVAAIVDAPSDQQGGWGMKDEFRLGEKHRADVAAVAADLNRRFPGAPLFLVGTSRGTISAAAAGAGMSPPPAGVVLTSSVFRKTGPRSKEPGPGLSGFDFASIQVPLLFVHHASDQCSTTPYGDAYRLADKYPLISVLGGLPPKSDACDALSQHGYYGRESETVEEIVNWMLKKPFKDLVQ